MHTCLLQRVVHEFQLISEKSKAFLHLHNDTVTVNMKAGCSQSPHKASYKGRLMKNCIMHVHTHVYTQTKTANKFQNNYIVKYSDQ